MSTDIIPHLFRTEYGKITAVLTRMLGVENLGIAEDIAGETFLAALETWPYKGLPANPVAWLYTVAKNKTKNYLYRSRVFQDKIKQLPTDDAAELHIDFSENNIGDSQLQMMFAICHPAISPEAQTGLALRILCGFSIDEIASAFLTSKQNIHKRLQRGREKLRTQNIALNLLPADQLQERLPGVLTTLYLLFSEGYYSENNDQVIRRELCEEAIRLAEILLNHPATALGEVHALVALMCFQASRLDARLNDQNELLLYEEQDHTKWNLALVSKGAFHFHASTSSAAPSRYHLEAGIAYWYTVKDDSLQKWEAILLLHNRLLQMQYSPVAALNRTYALAKARGYAVAIAEAEKIGLHDNRFYHMLLGKLYALADTEKALCHYQRALALATASAEKQLIAKLLNQLTAVPAASTPPAHG